MAVGLQIDPGWLALQLPDLTDIQPLATGGQKEVFAATHADERGKEELEKIGNEGLGDIPERAVKGLFSIPGAILDEFFGNEDEKRGYQDAIEGNDFDP